MIKYDEGKITISGSWTNIIEEYSCLTKAVLRYMLKNGMNPAVADLVFNEIVKDGKNVIRDN